MYHRTAALQAPAAFAPGRLPLALGSRKSFRLTYIRLPDLSCVHDVMRREDPQCVLDAELIAAKDFLRTPFDPVRLTHEVLGKFQAAGNMRLYSRRLKGRKLDDPCVGP